MSVEVYDGTGVRTLTPAECRWGHRTSALANLTVLALTLRLDPSTEDEVNARLADRRAFVRRTQDLSRPNLGTVFCSGYVPTPALRTLTAGGAAMSPLIDNWVLNRAGATYGDAKALIERVEADHVSRGFKPPVREVIVL